MTDNRMAATSLEAYATEQTKFETVRETVYHVIQQAMMPSSRDIARFIDVDRTTICGRLRELEDAGLIYKAGTKLDPFTHKKVNYYKICEGEE